MNITLPHNWKPRTYQQGAWDYLSNGGTRCVLKWHRRSGKDDLFLHHTACSMMERVGNYWYMLPEYAQARKSMWDAITGNGKDAGRRIDKAFPKEIRSSTKEQEMSITMKNGSTFQLVGSDNFNSLVGSPPVGLVFSEYALSNPSSWAYLMPIVEENGGWVGFNSTPRGKNHFKALCEYAESQGDWYYNSLTASESGVFSAEQLARILAQLQITHGAEYGRALWEQEYFVSFEAAMPGSIWGDCMTLADNQKRITTVPHTEGVLVHTGWDLGYDDDTAGWFYQVINREIKVIDTYDNRFKDVDHYADMLYEKKVNLGYQYGTHYLPHDARPRTMAAGGKSILQQFNAHLSRGIGRFAIAKRLDVQEGIQAARATFPLCSFDEIKCENGIDALKSYRREWDDEKKMFSPTPLHDWSSHYADAWRTVAVSWKFEAEKAGQVHFEPEKGNVIYQTFGHLKNQHLRKMRNQRLERE